MRPFTRCMPAENPIGGRIRRQQGLPKPIGFSLLRMYRSLPYLQRAGRRMNSTKHLTGSYGNSPTVLGSRAPVKNYMACLGFLLLATFASAQGPCLADAWGSAGCPSGAAAGTAIRGADPTGSNMCGLDAAGSGACAEGPLAAQVFEPTGATPAVHGQCLLDSEGRVRFDDLGRAMCAGGCAFGQ